MVALTVSVFDKNQELSFYVDNIFIPILIDDTVQTAKEKIFATNPNYPINLTKLYINPDTILDDPRTPLFNYFQDISDPILYVSAIASDLKGDNVNLFYENDEQFNLMLNGYIQEGYIDLTENDLKFAMNFILLTEYERKDLEEEINTDLEKIQDAHFSIQDKYINMVSEYQDFYERAKDFTSDITQMYITDIDLVIKSKTLAHDFNFVKLQDVFNKLPLDYNLPFIALNKKAITAIENTENAPLIKIFNKLDVPESEIKSWILNEKKKQQRATYKIIKGLLVKLRIPELKESFLTVNVLGNGVILVNVKLKEKDAKMYGVNLETILNLIKGAVDNLITNINELSGVFMRSRHLEALSNSDISIRSINTVSNIKRYLNRIRFIEFLQNGVIRTLLKYRPTNSPDVISAYYDKLIDYESDIKGITINIMKTEFDENESTTVKIFGTESFNQNIIILHLINIFLDMVGRQGDKVKTKKRTVKSLSKEEGYLYDSTKCQGDRQPILLKQNERPKKDAIVLNHQDKNFICKHDKYPYPGFTNDNIVCCFTKNQIGNESYIRNVNPDSLSIMVTPSNYPVKIHTNDGDINSYVIFSDSYDSQYNYYYLSMENKLEPITDVDINKEITDLDRNIWLDEVPLSTVLYPAPSNQCAYEPDLLNRGKKLHKICSNYDGHKYFGYTNKSIPCCFDRERELYANKSSKQIDLTKQYIIKSSNKILVKNQIGVLPDILNEALNSIDPGQNYFRLGVVQNNAAFLSAVLSGVDGKIYKENKEEIIEQEGGGRPLGSKNKPKSSIKRSSKKSVTSKKSVKRSSKKTPRRSIKRSIKRSVKRSIKSVKRTRGRPSKPRSSIKTPGKRGRPSKPKSVVKTPGKRGRPSKPKSMVKSPGKRGRPSKSLTEKKSEISSVVRSVKSIPRSFRKTAKRPTRSKRITEPEEVFTYISNYSELKKYISSTLTESDFMELNNGDLFLKYKSLQNYFEYIENRENVLYHHDLFDLLERIFSINIIILEKFEKEKDIDDIKIVCRPKIFKPERKTILILKHKKQYELVINLTGNSIQKSFNEDNKFLQFCMRFMKDTCIKQNVFPEEYPFIELQDYIKILQMGIKIKYQIVNAFNKVNMLMTDKNILLPIIETGIIENIGILQMSDLIISDRLLTLKKYVSEQDRINNIFKEHNLPEVSIRGICKAMQLNHTTYENIGGILTNYGYIIPYKLDKSEKSINTKIPVQNLDIIYYPLIDEVLINYQMSNSAPDYINTISWLEQIKSDIYNIKVEIGKYSRSHKEFKKDIIQIIKDTSISRKEKIKAISDNIKNIIDFNLDKKLVSFIVKNIANEMINDNIENMILNNVITSNKFNGNEIIIRDNESVLSNIADIKRWIVKYKLDE